MPQQNGVAECKNITIMNTVCSMLPAKKILKSFWPEAVNWTIYVLNRSPKLVVKDRTAEEAWILEKPSEWGDHEVARTDEIEEGNDEFDADIENHSSHSSTDDDAISTDEGRNRAPPISMRL
ncbi:UNVERIFIED_CONTAM: hypothetical protein Sradi_4378200 [Sesamum radiatum]|uniref:Uncharacterized protein n=1 Tax=Sesamum radiatum TaxID=300843 RepID=A0AAW2NNY8_SESRA